MARTFETTTDLEALLVEQALLMARELQTTADAAPDGQVLAVSELVALRTGRELTRRALEATLQAQAALAQKKTPPHARAPAVDAATTKDTHPRPS